MARIPLLRVEDMDAEQREQYDRFPTNLTRTLLLMDHRSARSLPESANALRASGLDPGLREAVILRVAALTGSAYERMQHLGQAGEVGWTPEQVTAIETGDLAALPEVTAAVLDLVEACLTATRVADGVVDRVRRVLSDRDLVTVLVLVGHYTTVARLLGTLEVELDDAPGPWDEEH